MDDISRPFEGEPSVQPTRRTKGPDDGMEGVLGIESTERDGAERLLEADEPLTVADRGAPVDDASLLDAEIPLIDPSSSETGEAPDELPLEEEAGRAPGDEEVAPDVEASPSDSVPALTDPVELSRVLMAILLTSRDGVSVLRLAQVCNASQDAVRQGVEQLEQDLRDGGFPLEVLRTGDSVRLMTVPEVFPYLERLRGAKKAERLSPAALETLAVIAYRQPVMRAEVEAIRGVKAGPMLRTLLEHKLVDVVGRADVPGRPLQYGTTQVFLDRFGLGSIKDLPSLQEFTKLG